MSTTKAREPRRHSDEFKLEVAGSYLRGEGTYRTLEKKYGVSKSRIHFWVRNFADTIGINPTEMSSKTPKSEQKPSDGSTSHMNHKEAEISALKEQLKQVQKDLACQRMRADVYNRMIDLDEDRWKIAIRKKSGAKQ